MLFSVNMISFSDDNCNAHCVNVLNCVIILFYTMFNYMVGRFRRPFASHLRPHTPIFRVLVVEWKNGRILVSIKGAKSANKVAKKYISENLKSISVET